MELVDQTPTLRISDDETARLSCSGAIDQILYLFKDLSSESVSIYANDYFKVVARVEGDSFVLFDGLPAYLASLPSHVVDQYAHASSEFLRSSVAQVSTSLSTLTSLGSDASPSVRAAVASNLFCPHALFLSFVHDPDCSVRASVAGNERCPTDLLIQLQSDPTLIVRAMANVTLSINGIEHQLGAAAF